MSHIYTSNVRVFFSPFYIIVNILEMWTHISDVFHTKQLIEKIDSENGF